MDKKTRLVIIIGSIITFIIVPVAAGLLFSTLQRPKAPTLQPILVERSSGEIKAAIIKSQPDLADNNTPIFSITKTSRPQPEWYIITIRNNDDPEGSNPAKVLLFDSGGTDGLNVLLGPGTSFPSDVTEPLKIPEPIVKELNS